ncbi:MAG: rRNA maturation RNase YbeY [Minisyncoccia bacterium]
MKINSKLKEKEKVEISLIFVNPAQIKKLNYYWRKKNTPTSVLSFPSQITFYLKKSIKNKKILKTKDLGEIIFCPAIIEKQSRKEKIDKKEKYRYLLAHSLLHLYGYSHFKKAEFLKMTQKEKILLEK